MMTEMYSAKDNFKWSHLYAIFAWSA